MPIFLQKQLKSSIFFVPLILICILLAGYILSGWQSRYLADDYCYDAQFMNHGFWQGQIDSYIHLMPYSSNRYSLTLFSGIAWALGGVRLMPVLPGAAILVWGLALFYSIRQGLKYFSFQVQTITTALITVNIVFYSLLLAPNQYQILFWRSGMLPYLVPLIFNTFLIGRLFSVLKDSRIRYNRLLELGLLAWLAAGFSETVFAIQAGFWGLVLLISLRSGQTGLRKTSTAILIGTFIGFALLVFNPTNSIRQSPFPPPPPLWTIPLTALRFAIDFFFYSVRGAWLPLIVLLSTGVLIGWVEIPSGRFRLRQMFLILVAITLGTLFLLVCNMAPTIWSMSAYPDPRGLFPGTYLLALFFITLGILAGAASSILMQRLFSLPLRNATSFILLLMISAYTIHFIPSTYKLISTYENRAKAWDARNNLISQYRTEGQRHIIVEGIDSIANIFELQPDTGHWVNQCAKKYYRIDSIATTE